MCAVGILLTALSGMVDLGSGVDDSVDHALLDCGQACAYRSGSDECGPRVWWLTGYAAWTMGLFWEAK